MSSMRLLKKIHEVSGETVARLQLHVHKLVMTGRSLTCCYVQVWVPSLAKTAPHQYRARNPDNAL